MNSAVLDARRTIRAADLAADDMARLLDGRLRHVSPYTLKRMKRQLKNFNIQTGQWKD